MPTPNSVEIEVVKFSQIQINNCIEYTFYIDGQNYQELPLDANVREPIPSKTGPYYDMCYTLRNHPEDFFENNLGISVVASRVEQRSKTSFRLFFEPGTGILNGGHTQLAILNCKDDPNTGKAIIRITVRAKKYELDRIAQIAAAQNSSTGVKPYSIAEKKGLFQAIKRSLAEEKEKQIIWYEGRRVPDNIGLQAEDLIALINVFNIDEYFSCYSNVNSQPTNSSTSKGKTFEKWVNSLSPDNPKPSSYTKLYPLVNDMLELRDYIHLRFYEGGTQMARLGVITRFNSRKRLIFSTEEYEYDLPKGFFYPLISSFRANVYFDKTNNKIGWYKDNKKLFDKSKVELCTKLRYFYSTDGNNEPRNCGKSSTLYSLLYFTLKEFIDYNKEPEVIYDIKE